MELLSEEEQWESMRTWLRKNGVFLLGVVILTLAALAGWRWWQARGEAGALAANAAHEQILSTLEAGQIDAGLSQIEALRNAQPRSPYVFSSDLAAVAVFVSRNEFDKAESRLKGVLERLPDENLRPLVQLRLARVQSAMNRNDEALATLGTANQGPHEAAFAEARGDVRLAKGDRAGALAEYQAARALLPADSQGTGVDVLLDLKINDLSSAAPAVTASETVAK